MPSARWPDYFCWAAISASRCVPERLVPERLKSGGENQEEKLKTRRPSAREPIQKHVRREVNEQRHSG